MVTIPMMTTSIADQFSDESEIRESRIRRLGVKERVYYQGGMR